MTEAQIIKYCKKGDAKGFKCLVNTYSSQLYGICLRYMNDEFEANDVLQECFIKIFNSIGNYENIGSFEAWITRIAVNTSLMALRKNKSLVRFLEPLTEIDKIVVSPIESEINEKDILEMLKKLPHHYRVIFNLAVIEGYKHSEIAEMLDIPESTSRTKLTRARKKMQEIYYGDMKIDSDNIKNVNNT